MISWHLISFVVEQVGIGNALPEMSHYPGSLEAKTIQYSYYLFSLLVVLLFLAITFSLWKLPTRPDMRPKLKTLGHVLYAWSALDVYVMGVLLTVIELGHGDFVKTPPLVRSFMERFFAHVLPGGELKIFAVSLRKRCSM